MNRVFTIGVRRLRRGGRRPLLRHWLQLRFLRVRAGLAVGGRRFLRLGLLRVRAGLAVGGRRFLRLGLLRVRAGLAVGRLGLLRLGYRLSLFVRVAGVRLGLLGSGLLDLGLVRLARVLINCLSRPAFASLGLRRLAHQMLRRDFKRDAAVRQQGVHLGKRLLALLQPIAVGDWREAAILDGLVASVRRSEL